MAELKEYRVDLLVEVNKQYTVEARSPEEAEDVAEEQFVEEYSSHGEDYNVLSTEAFEIGAEGELEPEFEEEDM